MKKRKESDALKAANERLRAALQDLLVAMGEGNKFGRAIDLVDQRYVDRARQALTK